jgi:benzil reductase ((S)-benzoin forming)
MAKTLLWISGATMGLGAGFVRTCPYPDARIINLSRTEAPGIENVYLDLADPHTWGPVSERFVDEVSSFDGDRVLFLHNAFLSVPPSFVGEGRSAERYRENVANFTASVVIGEAFVEAIVAHRPSMESGLVMLSSAAARIPWEGRSAYCAAKAGIEHWVRVVRRERRMRGTGPWVVAVRPGFVDTPGSRVEATYPARDYPIGPSIAAAFETMEGVITPEEAARDIWAALGDGGPKESVLLFGASPEGAAKATQI